MERRRKHLGVSTAEAPAATAPNVVSAVDFQFDADETGRTIKITSIVDERTCECLGGIVARRIAGADLTAHLDAITAKRGLAEVLRCDNGPELICQAMADWAGEVTGLHYIPPGSP